MIIEKQLLKKKEEIKIPTMKKIKNLKNLMKKSKKK